MSTYVKAEGMSEAWMQALEIINAERGGTATNLMVSISAPKNGARAGVTNVVDAALEARRKHSVLTVANTIFPSALYNNPRADWSPDLSPRELMELDSAAEDLYQAYLDSLPTLQQIPANRSGTYFSRMTSWPGRTATGANQLKRRILALRKERSRGRLTSNASDIAIAGEADGVGAAGGIIEEYAVSDTRTRGFPCLVHIDISVREGALSLLGVYRHWHLLTRGYGNMLGLAKLQDFLCQQTGYSSGELAIVAGHANAEHADYGGRSGVATILAMAEEALREGEATVGESA